MEFQFQFSLWRGKERREPGDNEGGKPTGGGSGREDGK